MIINSYKDDDRLCFTVETPEDVEAILYHFGSEDKEFQGGDDDPCHILHITDTYGSLYFYALSPEIAVQIWEHWFPEHREAREAYEQGQEEAQG